MLRVLHDETVHLVIVFGEGYRKELERDFAIQALVLRSVNLSHSALADAGEIW